jgi:hypothetical protein
MPAQMVGLYLVGIVLAIGRPFYYKSPVECADRGPTQQCPKRYGIARNFFAKSFLLVLL